MEKFEGLEWVYFRYFVTLMTELCMSQFRRLVSNNSSLRCRIYIYSIFDTQQQNKRRIFSVSLCFFSVNRHVELTLLEIYIGLINPILAM